jgi:hypothetical protein
VCRQRSISCSSALKNLSSPASVPARALLFFSPIHVFAAWLHFWHQLICCSIVPHVNNARFPLSVCVVLDFCCPGCDSRFSWPPDFLLVHAAVLVSLHLRSWVAGARFSSPYSIFLRELFVPPPDSKYMFSAVDRPSVCCLTRFGRAAIQVRCSV